MRYTETERIARGLSWRQAYALDRIAQNKDVDLPNKQGTVTALYKRGLVAGRISGGGFKITGLSSVGLRVIAALRTMRRV